MATTNTKTFVINSLIHRSSVLGVCTPNEKYFQEHGNLGNPKKTTFFSTKKFRGQRGAKNVTYDVACNTICKNHFNKISCGTFRQGFIVPNPLHSSNFEQRINLKWNHKLLSSSTVYYYVTFGRPIASLHLPTIFISSKEVLNSCRFMLPALDRIPPPSVNSIYVKLCKKHENYLLFC